MNKWVLILISCIILIFSIMSQFGGFKPLRYYLQAKAIKENTPMTDTKNMAAEIKANAKIAVELIKYTKTDNFINIPYSDQELLDFSNSDIMSFTPYSYFVKGLVYLYDRDIPKDLNKASEYFLEASKRGDTEGIVYFLLSYWIKLKNQKI